MEVDFETLVSIANDVFIDQYQAADEDADEAVTVLLLAAASHLVANCETLLLPEFGTLINMAVREAISAFEDNSLGSAVG